jgi:vacuolar-type H+-ATPase subunit D/Vma8
MRIYLKSIKIFSKFSFRAQTMMKARLAGAHKGHGLLKKKADALQMRFRLILGKIIEV